MSHHALRHFIRLTRAAPGHPLRQRRRTHACNQRHKDADICAGETFERARTRTASQNSAGIRCKKGRRGKKNGEKKTERRERQGQREGDLAVVSQQIEEG